MNTIISNKVHHYSLLLELDDEMKDWFESQLEKGKYLEHLIIEDRERQNYPETDEVHIQPEHKRTAGDYTIIHAVHVGDREVVVGENPAGAKDEKYMCGFCQQNELFARYEEILSSDDFPEIMGIFGKRVAEQAEKTRIALLTPKIQGIQDMPLTAEHCTLISHDDDINDKIVVLTLMCCAVSIARQRTKSSCAWAALAHRPTAVVRPATVWIFTPERPAAMSAGRFSAL